MTEDGGYRGGNGRSAAEAYVLANAAMKSIESHTRDCSQFRKELRDREEKRDRQRDEDKRAAEDSRQQLRELVSERTGELHGLLRNLLIGLVGFLATALVMTIAGIITFIAYR